MRSVRWLEKKLGGTGEENDVSRLSVDALRQEKERVRAEVKLRRDRHDDLARRREQLFDRVVDADDRLLKREIAGEIAAIEDEMALMKEEHSQLMESLQVIDGLLAIKRREEFAGNTGLIDRIREMSQDTLVDALRQADVQQLVREEKWGELNILLGDQLSTGERGREDEILEQAADVRQLTERVETHRGGRDVDKIL